MNKTKTNNRRRAQLLKEISDLEGQLASLKDSLPVHSLSPAMFQKLDDLEYKIKQKKAALQQEEPQPASQSND